MGSTPVLKSLQVTTMNNHNLLRLLWIQLTELSWTSCSHMEVIFLLREYRNLVTCNLRLNHQSLKNAVEQVLLPHLWKLMIHSLAGIGQFLDSLLLPALHDADFYKDSKCDGRWEQLRLNFILSRSACILRKLSIHPSSRRITECKRLPRLPSNVSIIN